MYSKWLRYILYAFFLLLGIFSFYVAFKDYPPEQVFAEVSKLNFLWLFPVYAAGLVGSLTRAWRWKIVLDASSAQKTSFFDAFYALMFGYFVNLGTPRLGEISRCLYLHRKNGSDTAYTLATVAVERVVDVLCLFICIFLALFFQWEVLYNFYNQYIFSFIESKLAALAGWKIAVAAIIGIALLILVIRFLSKRKIAEKILAAVKKGLLAVIKLKQKFLYLFLTAVIWFSYFLTSYFWLLAFGYGGTNAIFAGFTIMGVGAIARSLPIQAGGAGPYHALVSKVLLLFSFAGVDAIAYALVNHGSMIIYNLFFGVLATFMMRKKIG